MGGVAAAEPPEAAPPEAAPQRWELGALLGATLVDDENTLGNAPSADGVVDSGALVGLRVGYGFTERARGEIEGTYARPGFAGRDARAHLIAYRAHALVYLVDRRLRPFAVLGVGGTTLSTRSVAASDDSDLEVYWGIGGHLAATERIGVRLDLRHRIGPGRITTTSDLLEISIGVGWSP